MTLPPDTDCGDHAKRHDALRPRLRYCKPVGVGAQSNDINSHRNGCCRILAEASELELKV
jgi:hypothetical protein